LLYHLYQDLDSVYYGESLRTLIVNRRGAQFESFAQISFCPKASN
jgi:hypothetical protein